MTQEKLARALGWFSMGLGLTEVVAPGALEKLLGMDDRAGLIRFFGLREMSAGVGLLANTAKPGQGSPAPWMWGRLAGDTLDLAVLLSALKADNPKRGNVSAALAIVGGITLLDAAVAQALTKQERADQGNWVLPQSPQPTTPASYVRYSDSVEVIPPDENETIEQILASLHRLGGRTEEKFGHAIRTSHAKSHGIAVGELVVADDLPAPLAQGLFAHPGRYPVIGRFANVPGEITSDAVSPQRGLAIKILNVEGEMLPGHAGQATQDWVLDTGDRFAAANAKEFLMTHSMLLEHNPQIPEPIKEAASKVSFATNKALHAIGADSAHLDFFGSPRIHPLAEAYFTQVPIRYGDYIAKLAVVPVAPEQLAREKEVLDTSNDENALRTATVSYLRDHDAVFEIRVQLCTDLKTMPIENGTIEWSEKESPYQTVARLTFPRQEAYSPARVAYADDALSFCISHSLAAHRPLGGIMRARLRAYPEMSSLRRRANNQPLTEPQSISAVPA